ncbi:peptidase S8/S53 domain-containing protein [Clohesyomyces aquaticus]|uniref:Peptidase S8/S53 domain-containing protein n=1 Tax=Clohesyomyces aquaticus TaxID=1231657 RepID=A0A1Y1Z4D1_9PLEO|nr:peptidase S8/S53 domain-containing protein [Clohesyomyces aquaticus]
MRATLAFASLLASWSAVLAAPASKGDGFISDKTPGAHVTGGKEYIVLFNKNETVPIQAKQILKRLQLNEDDDDVLYTFNNSVFQGFVAKMQDHCIDALNSMTEVAHLEEKADIQSYTIRSNTTWGLQRLSNGAGASGNPQARTFTYTFDPASETQLGSGVDVYVVDTGVRTSHAVFKRADGTSRAQQGFSFTSASADGDGHGTHVAGTAAGSFFGVSSGANVFAVKVLGDNGSGSSSDTIAGMNWVINNHNKRKTQPGFVGSVMSMSWGLSGISNAVDQVVLGAVEAGIHVSVAAGNDGTDACTSTPSHNGGKNSAVVSVGSVNIQNQISSFSNTGSCVDIYAPGESVLSSWSTGDVIINFLSGTSMACPHVSGVMAYLMTQDTSLGQNPAALKQKLLATARQNAISGNAISGDTKLLLSNGADGKLAARTLEKDWVVVDGDSDLPSEKRTVTGSMASWAKDLASSSLEKRWKLHSVVPTLRF